MRTTKTTDGLTVKAIAGSTSVLLAFDLSEERRKGCVGFSIRRTMVVSPPDGDFARQGWLQQRIGGKLVSSQEAPIQAFRWSDASVIHAQHYNYRVVARYSMDGIAPSDPAVEVSVIAETPLKSDTAVFFNRGIAARDDFPGDVGLGTQKQPKDARTWLSNGLEEGLTEFLDQAKGEGDALHIAMYEISQPHILMGLKIARDRGVEIQIVYQPPSKNHLQISKSTESALKEAGLSNLAVPRRNSPMMHNKFVVRIKKGEPEAVWTGSTNWTDTAFYGQWNYSHAIYDREIARQYEEYFQLLREDPPINIIKAHLTPARSPGPEGFGALFSPRLDTTVLDMFGNLAAQSRLLLACNIAPTPSLMETVKTKMLDPTGAVFYLSGAGGTDKVFPETDIDVVPEGPFALNEVMQKTGAYAQAVSTIKRTGLAINARFLVFDPLGDDPVLLIGSASFSQASVTRNDENTVVIRGNTAAVDIYVSEFMHAFDSSLRESAKTVRRLATDDSWTERYYEPGNKHELVRRLFAGTSGSAVQPSTGSTTEETTAEEDDERRLADFSADSTVADHDFLSIDSDVNAFAALIASRQLKPPLSIGLFGEWGSGKTFFMHRMRRAVDDLSISMRQTGQMQRDLPFYKQIVQIEFNAWHYMEGNIWASIAEHIMKSLSVKGKTKGANETMMEALRVRLQLKQMARKDADFDVEKAKKEVEDASQAVTTAEQELEGQQQKLQDEKLKILSKEFLQGKLPELNSLLEELSGTTIREASEFKAGLEDAKRLMSGSQFLVPLRQAKDKSQRRRLLFAILIGAPLIGILCWVAFSFFQVPWGRLTGLITGSITALLAGVRWGNKQLHWVSQQMQKLRDIEAGHDRLLAEKEREVQELTDERNRKLKQQQDAIARKEEAEKKQEEAQQQVDEATPAGFFTGWLQDRAKEDDYRKYLGLLAIIRRDFDTLSDLMQTVNWQLAPLAEDDVTNSKKYGGLEKYKTYAEEDKDKDKQVSRIVLYIDDLDRCPPEKVVDVLQAVHLLLAFPLFVVVVGVDARWIKQSLTARYRQMLFAGTTGEGEQTKELFFGKATPDDYLEKIFQIPFWLKPMDQKTSWRMINGLLAKDPVATTAKQSASENEQNRPAGAQLDQDQEASKTDQLESPDSSSVEPIDESEAESLEGNLEASDRTDGEDESSAPTNRELPADDKEKAVSPADAEAAAGREPSAKTELAARSLEVTEAELHFMEQLAPLLSRSPRALKRFANVYRLIKAALSRLELDNFLNEKTEGNRIADYKAVLFLLAVDTGMPKLAPYFFSALEDEDPPEGENRTKKKTKDVNAQLESLQTKLNSANAADHQAELSDERAQLSKWLTEYSPVNKDSFLHEVADLGRLKYWVERTSRFSFQAYGVSSNVLGKPLSGSRATRKTLPRKPPKSI